MQLRSKHGKSSTPGTSAQYTSPSERGVAGAAVRLEREQTRMAASAADTLTTPMDSRVRQNKTPASAAQTPADAPANKRLARHTVYRYQLTVKN